MSKHSSMEDTLHGILYEISLMCTNSKPVQKTTHQLARNNMIRLWLSNVHLWDSPRAITFISDCGRPVYTETHLGNSTVNEIPLIKTWSTDRSC